MNDLDRALKEFSAMLIVNTREESHCLLTTCEVVFQIHIIFLFMPIF